MYLVCICCGYTKRQQWKIEKFHYVLENQFLHSEINAHENTTENGIRSGTQQKKIQLSYKNKKEMVFHLHSIDKIALAA